MSAPSTPAEQLLAAATLASAGPPTPAAAVLASQPRRRWARGPARPRYLQPDDVDPLLHIVIALMSEVSSLRDRLDTHELLAAGGVVATSQAVEAHVLSEAQRTLREQRRQAMLKRTLRVLTEQAESAGAHLAGQVGGGRDEAGEPGSV